MWNAVTSYAIGCALHSIHYYYGLKFLYSGIVLGRVLNVIFGANHSLKKLQIKKQNLLKLGLKGNNGRPVPDWRRRVLYQVIATHNTPTPTIVR